jgi:hypothetical protein
MARSAQLKAKPVPRSSPEARTKWLDIKQPSRRSGGGEMDCLSGQPEGSVGEASARRSISDDPNPRKSFLIAQDLAKDLLLPCLEDHSPVHDPCHDMVKGTAFAEDS